MALTHCGLNLSVAYNLSVRLSDHPTETVSNDTLEAGKNDGGATLVHCRVGVSRSATICIAEVMNEMGLSFPRA